MSLLVKLRATRKIRHRHIGYMPDGGVGYTSIHKGHIHELREVLLQEEIVDPISGSILQERATEIRVLPGPDGHTHPVSDVDVTIKPLKDPSERDKVAYVHDLFRAALENEFDSIRKGRESRAFRFNDQWEKRIKEKLIELDRPCLTINEIGSMMDLLSGIQKNNRSIWAVKPKEDGDQRTADIWTLILADIRNNSDFLEQENATFNDEIDAGRGNFHIYMDYDENVEGDVRIDNWIWDDVFWGPHNRKDARDAEYVIRRNRYSFGRLLREYPEKEKALRTSLAAFSTGQEDASMGEPHDRLIGRQYRRQGKRVFIGSGKFGDDELLLDVARKEIMVFELEQKEWRKIDILVNEDDGNVFNAEGWSKADLRLGASLLGFKHVYQMKPAIRTIRVAGHVLLFDEVDEDEDMFSMIPVYAYKNNERFEGKIERLKDPQRDVNKRYSQATEIMSTSAGYGWFYTKKTFDDAEEEENFRKSGSKPGFVVRVRSLENPPVKVDSSGTFPTGVVNMQELSQSAMFRIANIPPDLAGMPSGAESGIAILRKQRQGLVGNEFLFDNLNLAEKRVALRCIKLVQRYYTVDRIMRIIDASRRSGDITQEQFDNVQSQSEQDELLRIQELRNFIRDVVLGDFDIARYDIVISHAEWSPTIKEAWFFVWANLASQGIPVPPEFLVNVSSMPQEQTQKLLEMLGNQADAAQQADLMTKATELIKSGQDPSVVFQLSGQQPPVELPRPRGSEELAI